MDKFFFYYIDLAVTLIGILLSILYTYSLSRKSSLPLRKIPLFFVLFGPFTIISYMSGHLGEISFRAIQKVIAGNFIYNFHFYSLMLMGIVFMAMALYALNRIAAWSRGESKARKHFFLTALSIAVLSAPTFPFTPIGLLPALACGLSVAFIPFALKSFIPKKKRELQQV